MCFEQEMVGTVDLLFIYVNASIQVWSIPVTDVSC